MLVHLRIALLGSTLLTMTLPAAAAVKLYDSSPNNGQLTQNTLVAIGACPPVQSLNPSGGYKKIIDDGLGTVTLEEFVQCCGTGSTTNLGPDALTGIFGPGAFIFVQNASTRSLPTPHVSTTSGIGAHGPSGTDPGESAEWGVISGFELTGLIFCISSPVTICNQNGFSHGATIPQTLASTSYDLGTWNFDAEGDIVAANFFITRTTNGGLTNTQETQFGAFVGSALPALPLIGFGVLAVALTVIGGRTLIGRK